MGMILRRVCRGCDGLFPNEGSLFTHGYCRECWRERRSDLSEQGALRCGQLPPLGPINIEDVMEYDC